MLSKKSRRRFVADINVVPYIDVMLVLLIVFMVTAPLLMQGVEVELPKAVTTPLDSKDKEPLIVSIKANGTYYIDLGGDKNRPAGLEEIVEKAAKVLAQMPDTPVLIWGDAKVEYGEVVNLMAALQGAGAPSVGLVTEAPAPE